MDSLPDRPKFAEKIEQLFCRHVIAREVKISEMLLMIDEQLQGTSHEPMFELWMAKKTYLRFLTKSILLDTRISSHFS